MFLKNSKRAGNAGSTSATSTPAKPSATGRPSGATSGPSLFSADLAITGDIVSEGEIQIDGSVNGDVQCTNLTIGETGNITGEVHGDTVRIHGRVEGQIYGKTVFLSKSARVIGDISHESLAIEPGAYMEGHCQHVDQADGGGKRQTKDKPASAKLLGSGQKTTGESPAGGSGESAAAAQAETTTATS